MTAITALKSKLIIAAAVGFLIGVGGLVALRLATYQPHSTHYHANFALYVNGQRQEFKNFSFYEEIQACGQQAVEPKQRVHMHGNINHVVHVHDEAATWGHFSANLGYGLGNRSLQTDDAVLVDGASGQLTFILNGQTTDSLANRVIGDQDRLLINYGNEDTAVLNERFAAIPADAGEHNLAKDPGGCGGDEQPGGWQRLKQALGLG